MFVVKFLWRLVPLRWIVVGLLALSLISIGTHEQSSSPSQDAGRSASPAVVHPATAPTAHCSAEQINANKQTGLQILTEQHREAEWANLETLWDGVHSWCDQPTGGVTGHCGISQGPCGQVGTTAETQIRWGLSYIQVRYGTATAALAYWKCAGRCSFTHATTKKKVTARSKKAGIY